MKEHDKNSLFGFVLIAIILVIFNTFFFPEATEEKQDNLTSISKEFNSNLIKKETPENEFNIKKQQDNINHLHNQFANTGKGSNEYEVIENDKLKITISNKGGRIIGVILKEYKTYSSLPLNLLDSDSSNFNLQFTTGETINTSDLYFKPVKYSNKKIGMRLESDSSRYVEYIYTINDDYIINLDIKMIGMNSIIPENINYINLEWQMKTPQTEKSKSGEDMYTGIHYQYSSDKEVDYLSFTSDYEEEKINSRLNWVGFKQQFFSSIFIAKDGFQKPTLLKSEKNENSKFIKDLYAKFELPYTHQEEETLKFEFFFGPNHYKTLQSYNSNFEEIIPLGWAIFGWINEYIIINLFDFLNNYISNYGIIILLLTIIIKLCLAPFTYKTYLSQAKMKVLKPEVDKINEKYKGGKDPMKMQQETLALYRKTGVNPMGGCLPMLFQFPILIAMFRFFPASIELRQESFLWADDLSAYDSILDLPFNIPFYGDHVSLFTLLMTISTLLYTKMNASMATGQMAQMKWMMYLMPIMFLGFFNNYAAGLSYYYFLANMITFSQQFIMKRFIDEEAILSELERNKKKPKKKSKFQKKLEELQKKQAEQLRKKR